MFLPQHLCTSYFPTWFFPWLAPSQPSGFSSNATSSERSSKILHLKYHCPLWLITLFYFLHRTFHFLKLFICYMSIHCPLPLTVNPMRAEILSLLFSAVTPALSTYWVPNICLLKQYGLGYLQIIDGWHLCMMSLCGVGFFVCLVSCVELSLDNSYTLNSGCQL